MNTIKRSTIKKYPEQVIITANKHEVIHTLGFLYIKDKPTNRCFNIFINFFFKSLASQNNTAFF